ncbi:MAG: diaminohydroxyphosphoribosylaminopyrimidine deaminase [Rhizobiaceae bacterium]|nr:diaminohydroxyphosphoribosylaminopyrimidine deaminase [Rhizobiaceae bacterium]
MSVSALPPSALPGISPSRGEIAWGRGPSQSGHVFRDGRYALNAFGVKGVRAAGRRLISPLEGEMSGRTEGGKLQHSRGWRQ